MNDRQGEAAEGEDYLRVETMTIRMRHIGMLGFLLVGTSVMAAENADALGGDLREWLHLFNQLGLPIGLVFVLLRALWPFMVRRIEVAEQAREASQKVFTDTLQQIGTESIGRLEQIGKNLEHLTLRVEDTHREVLHRLPKSQASPSKRRRR